MKYLRYRTMLIACNSIFVVLLYLCMHRPASTKYWLMPLNKNIVKKSFKSYFIKLMLTYFVNI